MRTVAVLPVKRFRDSLQRLSDELGIGARSSLAQTMFRDVLTALRRSDEIESIVVVTSDREAVNVAKEHEVWVFETEADGGHSHDASIGISKCAAKDFERALLVSLDCPLIDPLEIDGLLRQRSQPGVVVVPDRHGTGTNALLLAPMDSIQPAFGPGSRERHCQLAREQELECQVVELSSLALDIDTMEDLDLLKSEVGQVRGRAQLTSGAIRQLTRTVADRPSIAELTGTA